MIERLREDLKAAMRAGDRARVGVLRMVLSEAHNREIERHAELEDDDVVAVLRKAVKMRRDAAEQYDAGGAEGRAAAERAEIEILEAYLPSELDEAELEAAIAGLVDELGASGMKDMGRVMSALMERFPGRVDGKAASTMVRARLS
jgi:uncharacterized protein YqeY